MKKFLFTDGITGVKQVQSIEELESLIESSEQPEKLRIWIYSSNEWISCASYRKMFPALKKERAAPVVLNSTPYKTKPKKTHWVKRLAYITGAALTIFLVFNFTKIKWQTAGSLTSTATRPANVPEMDIDSLIMGIENERGQSLDRSTRTNLRLRNTWPERILLQANADKETSSAGSRLYNVRLSVDNTTGFPLDQAVVRLIVWKNNKPAVADTFQFNNILYDKVAEREALQRYKGDSISAEFQSIRAKAFNFFYSSALKNEAGEYNDRWFSRN